MQGGETAAEAEAAVAALNAEELASMNAGSDRSSDGRRSGGESPRGLTHVRCAPAAAADAASHARPNCNPLGHLAATVSPPRRDTLQHRSTCCWRCAPGCQSQGGGGLLGSPCQKAPCWVTCGAWGLAQGGVHAAGVPQRGAV